MKVAAAGVAHRSLFQLGNLRLSDLPARGITPTPMSRFRPNALPLTELGLTQHLVYSYRFYPHAETDIEGFPLGPPQSGYARIRMSLLPYEWSSNYTQANKILCAYFQVLTEREDLIGDVARVHLREQRVSLPDLVRLHVNAGMQLDPIETRYELYPTVKVPLDEVSFILDFGNNLLIPDVQMLSSAWKLLSVKYTRNVQICSHEKKMCLRVFTSDAFSTGISSDSPTTP